MVIRELDRNCYGEWREELVPTRWFGGRFPKDFVF